MAATPMMSIVAAKAALDAVTALVNGGGTGNLYIRSGALPATTLTADAGTLGATLPMSATAFGSVSDAAPGAIMTAATITGDSSADATDTAVWFRMLDQAGGNTIMDGTVGTSGCDINFNTVSFVSGSTVDITSMTITQPES